MHQRFSAYQLFPLSSSSFPNQAPSLLLVISKPSSLFLPHFSTSSATPVQVYILMKEKLFFEVTTLSPWRIGGVKKLLKRFSSKIFWTGEKNLHITLLTPWPWPPEGEGYVKKKIDDKDFFLKMVICGEKIWQIIFLTPWPPWSGGSKILTKKMATRAVDKRASELNAEYLAKAKQTDQTYCGTTQGTIGPVKL